MTDSVALHAAVCANPEDDTPRLAFADWLDENGQGKRAAFIRADVERHRYANSETALAAMVNLLTACRWPPGNPVDWSRIDPEMARFQRAKSGPKSIGKPTAKSENLPQLKGVEFGAIERGFHSLVTVSDPDVFLANADTIFRATPITGVHFLRLGAAQAQAFVAAGHLGRIRQLGFHINQIEMESLRLLGNHADTPGVRSLNLVFSDGDSTQLAALGEGSRWTGITRMEWDGWDYGDDMDRTTAALLRRPQFRKLRHFRSTNTTLGDRTCRAIAGGLTELRHLDLDGNAVGESGAGAIASSKTLPNLRFLDLFFNSIGTAAVSLINTPKLPNLTALRTHWGRGLDPKGLTRAGRGPTLRGLSLASGQSGEDGSLSSTALAALGACPALSELWYLEFSYCRMSDTGLAALARSAAFRNLAIIEMAEPAVTDRGLAALAGCPALASLQDLHIAEPEIGLAGAKAIVASPHLQGLRRLLAQGRGVAHLRKHFGKKVGAAIPN